MQALIVDDSRATRMLLGTMIRSHGFYVETAGDGIEALEILERCGTPDLILVDWNMPKMDGIEFVQKVRTGFEGSDVPIVMVTANTNEGDDEIARVAGVDAYITKPFSNKKLGEILASLGLQNGN